MNFKQVGKGCACSSLYSTTMCLQTTAQVNYKKQRRNSGKVQNGISSDIYENWDDWEADFKAISVDMEEILSCKGTLGESSDNLLKLMTAQENLMKKAYKVYQFSFRSKALLIHEIWIYRQNCRKLDFCLPVSDL